MDFAKYTDALPRLRKLVPAVDSIRITEMDDGDAVAELVFDCEGEKVLVQLEPTGKAPFYPNGASPAGRRIIKMWLNQIVKN